MLFSCLGGEFKKVTGSRKKNTRNDIRISFPAAGISRNDSFVGGDIFPENFVQISWQMKKLQSEMGVPLK